MAPDASSRPLVLQIAGLGLEVKPAEPGIRLVTDAAHEPFLARDAGLDCASVVLAPLPSPRPPKKAHRTVFDTGSVWRLEETHAGHLLTLRSPIYGHNPYLAVEFDRDYAVGAGETVDGGPHLAGDTMHPFVYPFDEVVFLARLARGRGVLVHACGLVHRGRGILLLGTSGAGKSTSARLWSGRPATTILSDDRIVIRADAAGPRIYGTPWHGEAGIESPGSAPLDAVFILEQAPRNRVIDLPPSAAVAQMMVRAFPALWEREGLEFAVRFLSGLAEQVPVRRLQFLPDASAVDCVLASLGGPAPSTGEAA
ncbi:MAG TPA: hypothetical protein VFC25_03795 [Verrucomicrobiae bacterium]|nr:hypothetical protein [Verrucomicrobiae bacterium]